jgi:hypothetical protein
MRTGRTLFLSGLVSAVAGLIAAPRGAASLQEALMRLRASVQRRGGLSAFAGTPCSADDEQSSRGSARAGGDASDDEGG